MEDQHMLSLFFGAIIGVTGCGLLIIIVAIVTVCNDVAHLQQDITKIKKALNLDTVPIYDESGFTSGAGQGEECAK